MTYLHLNGLHGEAKYYKYLIKQLDFENQVADEIRQYCKIYLKPIVLNQNYILDSILLEKIMESINCQDRLLNPYVKEIQFALEYFFDADEISKCDRESFKQMLSNNYNELKNMNEYFTINNYSLADYEYEDMFDIVINDYNDLLHLLVDYNV